MVWVTCLLYYYTLPSIDGKIFLATGNPSASLWVGDYMYDTKPMLKMKKTR